MTPKTSLSVALSQEELFVSMMYLQAQQFPGLDLGIFKKLDETQTNLMMGIAERALLARGFLKPGQDGRLQLEAAVNGLLSACLFPETSLFVHHTRSGAETEEYFFHAYRKMFVMHSIPLTAIHQFIAVEDQTAIARAVLSILALPSLPKPKGKSAQIQLSLLEKGRDIALERGAEEAFHVLQTELDDETARELARTLAEPTTNTAFAYLDHRAAGRPPQGLTILQGKQTLWLLQPSEDPQDERTSIWPLSSEEVIRKVKSILMQ